MNTKRFTPLTLFLIVSYLGIVSFFLYALLINNEASTWMIQENNFEVFGVDYFTHVWFGSVPNQLYERTGNAAGCFPPLAYILYYAMYCLSALGKNTFSYFSDFYAQKSFLYFFTMYSIIVGVLLYYAITNALKHMKQKNLVFFSVFLSAPILGSGFLAGNSTLIVLGLLLIALYLRDCDGSIPKEIALLLIAVCAALKIYPAIFGLLYLKEKRYKETLRLIVYGILLFFIPFVFFGGIRGFLLWGYHIVMTMGMLDLGRIQYIKGMIYTVLCFVAGVEESSIFKTIASIISILFLLMMVWLAWRSKSKSKTIFFLTSAIIFFPSNSFRYTLGYYVIPLTFWINEKIDTEYSIADCLIGFLYGCIYTIPTFWGMITQFQLDFGYFTLTYVEVWVYTMAYILLIAMIILEVLSKHQINTSK